MRKLKSLICITIITLASSNYRADAGEQEYSGSPEAASINNLPSDVLAYIFSNLDIYGEQETKLSSVNQLFYAAMCKRHSQITNDIIIICQNFNKTNMNTLAVEAARNLINENPESLRSSIMRNNRENFRANDVSIIIEKAILNARFILFKHNAEVLVNKTQPNDNVLDDLRKAQAARAKFNEYVEISKLSDQEKRYLKKLAGEVAMDMNKRLEDKLYPKN